MAGRSSREKSQGLGYQGPGTGPKTDYSSNARNSYDTEISRNQRMNQITPNQTNVIKSPANPIGRRYLEPIGPVKPKSVPRTYVPTLFKPKPPVAVKPPAKKPPAPAKSGTRAVAPTQNSSVSKKPPATRFGTVTGKTTGTTVRGGGGYGGGGTRGGGSLSGGGSGSRSAGTSRTGGTQRNDPVRG